ncbi:MAG: hypothetical protein AB7F23_05045 [Phycisphaerae bacterium]
MTCKQMLIMMLVAIMLPAASASPLDTAKYIPLSEIRAGMEGYALSVYKGTQIERFPLKVVDVIENYEPGRDAFLVMGTGDKFKHTGPVAGCSGSPVVLDGRIAGALAFGWSFPKDPLYGVTPIEEMLAVETRTSHNAARETAPSGGLGVPQIIGGRLDSETFCAGLNKMLSSRLSGNALCSNMAQEALSSLAGFDSSSFFFTGASGFSGGKSSALPNFEPGSTICIPLVDGDINMSVLGTVTAINGDNVYAFGHSFTGMGKVSLPFSAGVVHTVMASQSRSFKIGSPTVPVGTIIGDEQEAVYGIIGRQAPTIPMAVKINSFDSAEPAIFNLILAEDQYYTPMMVQNVIAAAAFRNVELPEFHSVSYRAVIKVDGLEDYVIENVSSGRGMRDAAYDTAGIVSTFAMNEYKRPRVLGIDFEATLSDENLNTTITTAEANDLVVEPGAAVSVNVTLEKEFGAKFHRTLEIKVPEDLAPGKKTIQIFGADGYRGFVDKMRPARLIYDDFDSLAAVMRRVISDADRRGLYAVMQTERSGLSVGRFELEGLPDTMAPLLGSSKRNYSVKPAFDWVEQAADFPYIVKNQLQIEIEVKRNEG